MFIFLAFNIHAEKINYEFPKKINSDKFFRKNRHFQISDRHNYWPLSLTTSPIPI